MDSRRIGEILLDQGAVTERDLDDAARYQAELGGPFGQALLRTGALAEETLLSALSAQLDLPVITADHLPEDPRSYHQCCDRLGLSAEWLLQHDAVAWLPEAAASDGEVEQGPDDPPDVVAVFARAPLDPALAEPLERTGAGDIRMVLGPNRLLDAALAALRTAGRVTDEDAGDDIARLRELAEEAPVIDLVNGVFEDALRQRASDVHIEPFEHHFQIRFRIDGVLHNAQTLPRGRFDAVASRVKLLSGMDIAERRLPQDGRQSVRFAGQDIDLRVSSLPGAWGESLVLRLLRKQQSLPSLEGLGLEGAAMAGFEALVAEKNGVILVTGPTGSGKSTTLYRGLERVNDGERKIITIEDPVEYDMEGVTQVQARADIGYTFARGLRAILRQDPDVIMIGEIRDGETASIATQAALTGHLVLSTLHTNSALAAIERLIDLGVERFLAAASLRGLIGQRLVRRVCEACAEPAEPSECEAADARLARARAQGAPIPLDAGGAQWKRAVGCKKCSGTGYSGRIAVFEVARFTPELRDAVMEKAGDAALMAAARKDGFLTLYEDGLLKAARGLTTVEEIVRVIGAAGPGAGDPGSDQPGASPRGAVVA
ncbi:MAG: ATPase, T2SS/T4P/T4SS family [Pseudomonadota bacterium]